MALEGYLFVYPDVVTSGRGPLRQIPSQMTPSQCFFLRDYLCLRNYGHIPLPALPTESSVIREQFSDHLLLCGNCKLCVTICLLLCGCCDWEFVLLCKLECLDMALDSYVGEQSSSIHSGLTGHQDLGRWLALQSIRKKKSLYCFLAWKGSLNKWEPSRAGLQQRCWLRQRLF